MWHHRVGAGAWHDALVLGRIGRLVRLDIVVTLAVAVGVEDERRPALRLRGIAGRIEYLGVEPSRDGAGAAEPQRVVSVIAELRVMGAEAGVDEDVLHRFGIENRRLTPRPLDREHLGRRMLRSLLAERRVVWTAHVHREPNASALVEHAVVVVGTGVPNFLVAPIG